MKLTRVKKPIGVVYLSTCNVTGKQYVGQHKGDSPEQLKNPDYFGSGCIINLAIDKYGAKAFTRITLAECYTQKELDEKELEFIFEYNAAQDPGFYNVIDFSTKLKDWGIARRYQVTRNMHAQQDEFPGVDLFAAWKACKRPFADYYYDPKPLPEPVLEDYIEDDRVRQEKWAMKRKDFALPATY
jgi:hypothetical protein